MYRLGHTGIALLVLAPLSYGLLEAHKPLLALIIALGVLAVEPLPDLDFKVPFLTHRGVSHSLLAAVSIGGIIALCGWFVGVQAVTVLASVLSATSEVVTTVATSLESLAPPEATGSIVVWIVGLLTEVVASLDWIVSQLQGLGRQTMAGVGFAVGAGGILVHLLGDVITVSGIRPFLPFSDWKLSVSSLRAKSTLGNTGFFAVGVLAVVVVLSTAGAGIGFAVIPADLSPVGVAAGQSTTQSQNQSEAVVVFENQTTNGSTVTIERATLPEGGFIAVHTGGYATGPAPADASIIAVSERLSPGTYRNVTIDISHAPSGNYPGLNRSRLNESGTVAVALYRDTNGNQQFDFVRTFGANDTAYTVEGGPVTDAAVISVPSAEEERRTASVAFESQTLRNNTIIVERARLPKGGFLVALNESYQRTGDPLTSAVGISRYLAPGNYTNVPLRVLPGALNESQVVTVIPAQDTNGNQRYDYIRSDGFQDVAYVTANRSGIVSASAQVSVQSGDPTPTQRTQTQTATPQTTPTSTPTETHSPAVENASGRSNESIDLLDSLGIVGIAGIVVILAAGIIAIRRFL